ncbi:hypothetical protein CC85DRAFT_283019 [Cutaneotrichosporon oleaginosum]|uniref:Uncharacterized protein n=1 Tax=Cutaneotrichosporon oleaginosum TaxID=879819 RepID=A0A0J0XVJ9_9TREE|nr:uncharacterized protein CC85DRAFT_283019 [Cutaneotrichosporon oleaginosum]KLT45105.1 hypothetical protein CC85DRAFT_283019 [Cutaneotrichosporon oleaginosum]TXT09786.1 hypothetical protein COLE_03720 [Cutaneotrichosporon oleaginosum]
MPVTFSEPSGRRMSTGRRPSASSPYPVRVMTSIKPSDYPSPPKRSPKKKEASVVDPFVDDAAPQCCPDLDCHTNSPQDERVALPADSERQPLLGRTQKRRARHWSLLAGLVLVLVVGSVIVGGVARMHSQDE